jgi:L-malate glycosyltransferase
MGLINLGENREAVIDGVTGLVVPSHDPPALAAVIVRLAVHSKFRERFGIAGRRGRIESRFTQETGLAQRAAVY